MPVARVIATSTTKESTCTSGCRGRRRTSQRPAVNRALARSPGGGGYACGLACSCIAILKPLVFASALVFTVTRGENDTRPGPLGRSAAINR